ncbi:MAG: SRPBCC family protein, partial [Acidimicrobiia bacterium]
MKARKSFLTVALIAMVVSACRAKNPDVPPNGASKGVQPMNVESKMVPPVSSFTTSPLRNRMRVELKAPVTEVWSLIGNLARFPEYSSGLERVEA